MSVQRAVDYVVVGAGSSGCVVANRLSEDDTCTVLLLEAGNWDDRPEIHNVEVSSFFALLTSEWAPHLDWGYITEEQDHLKGRRIPIERGKVVGGCSSVNALMWVRGSRFDYDHWSALGNPGWAFEEILPFFKQAEDYEGGASNFRGAGGLTSVREHSNPTPIAQAFVLGVQELGYGGPEFDYNGFKQEDFGFFYQTNRTKEGQRCSAATAYLHPILSRPNLSVEVGAQATLLLFRGQRVIGLEYVREGRVRSISVDREVVVSCGTFETPKLLMLSGIGPAEHLNEHGIRCVQNLPGVGQNLQDHLFLPICYQSKRDNPPAELVSEAGLFIRTRNGVSSTPPDLQFTFGSAKFLGDDAPAAQREGPGFTFGPVAIRPQSQGQVTLRDDDPSTPAILQANYLDAKDDLDVFVHGIKLAREIAQTRAFDDFRGEELAPGEGVASDSELRDFVAANATTLWHPVGTCRMGTDPYAVVDPELRVHGVEGLRVVDGSVMPSIVAGNTNAPCVMIGEKAADLIKRSFHSQVKGG